MVSITQFLTVLVIRVFAPVGLCCENYRSVLFFSSLSLSLSLSLSDLQHALRLIAFSKLHLVLGVDPLPPPGQRRFRRQQPEQEQEQQQQQEGATESEPTTANGAGNEEEDVDVMGVDDDDVAPKAGIKREPSDVQEESEGVKKIKLES